MKNRKTVLLLLIIFVMTAASLYLVYIIQDGTSPLAIFNTRAADETQALDEDLNNLLAKVDGTATPTLPYKSTSPSPTLPPGGATSPQTPGTASPSGTLQTPTLSPTQAKNQNNSPTTTPTGNVIYVTATPMPSTVYVSPTPITTLPVAGFADDLPKYVLGGGLLVIVGMLL